MDEAVTPLTPALSCTIQPASTDWLAEAVYITSQDAKVEGIRPCTTLYDTQRVYRMLKLVSEGNYLSTAIIAAGFARQTLTDWKRHAEMGNVAAIAMVDALEKAQAEAEGDIVGYVRKAAQKEQFWAAGMTLLERRHPEKWGRRQDSESGPKVVVQIGTTSPADVKVAILSPTVSTDMHRLTADSEAIEP